MMPPTVILAISKDHNTKEDKIKHFHEVCSLRFLKPPPMAYKEASNIK
jgi:hypothetical protein